MKKDKIKQNSKATNPWGQPYKRLMLDMKIN
jgi:hypothetical protein